LTAILLVRRQEMRQHRQCATHQKGRRHKRQCCQRGTHSVEDKWVRTRLAREPDIEAGQSGEKRRCSEREECNTDLDQREETQE
jgi:hypothetical protein